MNIYQLILQRYGIIIAGQSTESIKQAEMELAKLEQNQSFVPDNAAIICQPNHPIAVRKFAAIYLSKYSKKIVKQKTIIKSTFALQQYLAILKSQHLEIELKMLIVSPIEIILGSSDCKVLKQEFVIEYQRLLNQAEKQEDLEVNFIFIVFCGQALFAKDSYNEDMREIIKTTMESLIKLIIRLLGRVTAEKTLENRDNSLVLLRILKEYSVLLKQYFKRLALLDIQCMKMLFLPQLEIIVGLALNFNYRQNQIDSSIFISIANQELFSKIANIIKANFLVILTNFIRMLFSFTKHANLFTSNPLYLKIPEILNYCIKSTSSLLQRVPYYQLPHRIMILESLDETLNFFISCLRMSNFYQNFFDAKLDMIEKIIMPCLSLSPNDIENFYEDSQEFVHNTLQIVGRDLRIPNSTFMSNQEPEEQIKQYETLRTLAAEFLSTFCKFQDGTLSQVVEYVLAVLNSNGQGQKTLMFLIVCILAPQFKERKDLKIKIIQTVMEMIKNCPIPVMNGTRKQEDLQYAYLLLTLSKIFFYAIELFPDVINQSYKIGISIIQSPSVNEVHKFFIFDMFSNLAKIDEGSKYVQDLLAIYNHLLKNIPEPTIHFLDSYYFLIKYNSEEIKKNPAVLIQAIKYICMHIEKEIQKPQPFQILMSKQWNIIRQVGESQDFVPALIQPIQELIVPLLPYIDGQRNVDYQEDILMLLTSFIDKGKRVTLNQQKMFEIIPRIFYSQYSCRFGQSFHAIQLFIYYGSDILSQNYPAIESIIDMCLVSISTLKHNKRPMNESQNCEGALILQSLILKCGNFFTIDAWKKVINTVQKRFDIQPIKFNILSSNLYALLSLSLIHSYKFFPDDENEILMAKIISQIRVFNKIQYSPKVVIAGLTELLLKSECGFVGRRFTQILDMVITLLEVASTKKESYFDEQEDEEKEYSNAIIMLKNDLKQLDQFTFFRQQVEKLKKKNLPLLQKSVSELPKAKKDFFTHILRIQRVANEPRQIYKIKR